jgi:hypothetical protein
MKLRIGALTVLFLSLALPLAAQVGGGGTTNYIPIWTDSNTLGDSTIYETNGMVGVGTTSPTATLTVLGANGGAAQTPVLQVTGGMGGSGFGRGGGILLAGGPGGRRGGGSITVTGGDGGANGAKNSAPGGAIQLSGGTGGAGQAFSKAGPGGSITIAGGIGGAPDPAGGGGDGGSITLQAGAAVKLGKPGNVLVSLPQGGEMEILGGRGVGIGTPRPKATLDIKVGGTTLADAWTTRSSRRFKTNIKPLEGALEKVEQLQGVYYERKVDGKHEIGVVAEDVAQVVPEVVSRDPKSQEVQGVDYSRLAALLIEAVKSQQAEIQQLKIQVLQLRSNPRGQ